MNFSVEKRNKYLELIIRYQKERLEKGEECNIIGERVKYFRNELGLNKNAFCKYARIERTTLYKVEEGKITPSLKTLIKIVDALNIVDFGFVLPKEEFDRKYTNSLISDYNLYNIYMLEDEVKKLFQNKTFCFYQKEELKFFPQSYLDLLIDNIHASFAALELIKHDKEQGDSFLIEPPISSKNNNSNKEEERKDEDTGEEELSL